MTERPFEGRVALVTGGGTGIGAGISARLADMGAAVMIAQRTEDKARSVLAALEGAGRQIDAVGFDLARPEGCTGVVPFKRYAGKTEDPPYYIMPYARKGSLADLLKKRGQLPVPFL